MLTSSPNIPRRRRTVRYAVAASAAMAAALSGILLSAGSSGASAAPRPAIPAAAVPALRAGMLDLARYTGDAHPASVNAVITSRARALQAATPGETVPGSTRQTVYLVVLIGHFTDTHAAVPPGAKIPVGRYLTVTINRATGQLMDLSLSNHRPPVSLSSYGPVSALVR
jgi:hypothetical protein